MGCSWLLLASYPLSLSRVAIATPHRVGFANVKATFPRSQKHTFSPCAAYPRPRRLAPLRNAPPRHLGPSLHAGRYQFAGVRNRTEIQTHPNEETRRGRSSPIARRRREAFVQRCVPNPSGTSCAVAGVWKSCANDRSRQRVLPVHDIPHHGAHEDGYERRCPGEQPFHGLGLLAWEWSKSHSS